MIAILLTLVMFHGPGGQVIWVNPDAVVSTRLPRQGEHFAPGIRCLINTSDGKFTLVMETCEEVEQRTK
jgi:hypothetical protein